MSKTIPFNIDASSTPQQGLITIEDPVPNLSGNTIGFTQKDPQIKITGGTPIDPGPVPNPDQNFSFIHQDITVSDYVRDDAGASQWMSGTGTQSPLPDLTKAFVSTVNEKRFNWTEFESSAGVYNFKNFDTEITKCKANGWRLAFRVVSFDGSGSSQIYPSAYGSTKEPDWNSDKYITGLEKLLKALSDYIFNKGYTRYICGVDKSGQGNWSEDHYYGAVNTPATSANTIRIWNATLNNFPGIRKFITISGLVAGSKIPVDAAMFQLTSVDDFGPVGIRSDHLGDAGNFDFDTVNNSQSFNGVKFGDLILNRWKTSEIKGELLNNLSSVNASSPYSDLVREVQKIGMSTFSNANEARRVGTSAQVAASDKNLLAAAKLAGARPMLQSAIVHNGMISIVWFNYGNAPVYERWDTYFLCGSQKIKSSSSIRGMMPGQSVSMDVLPAGAYSLYVVILDAQGYRSPYFLYNTGRLADGSYKIGDVKI